MSEKPNDEQLSGKVTCDAKGFLGPFPHSRDSNCVNPRPAQTQAPESTIVSVPAYAGGPSILEAARKHATEFMRSIDVRGTDAQWLATCDRLTQMLASIDAPAPSLDALGDLSVQEIAEFSAHAATSHDADGCSCDYAHLFPRLIAEVKRRRPAQPYRCAGADWHFRMADDVARLKAENDKLRSGAAPSAPSDALRDSLVFVQGCVVRAAHGLAMALKGEGVEGADLKETTIGVSAGLMDVDARITAALAASPSMTRPEINEAWIKGCLAGREEAARLADEWRGDALADKLATRSRSLPAPTAPKEPPWPGCSVVGCKRLHPHEHEIGAPKEPQR